MILVDHGVAGRMTVPRRTRCGFWEDGGFLNFQKKPSSIALIDEVDGTKTQKI